MGGALAGRTALVTGASSGIGLATARLFAAEGAEVHGASRRQVEGEPFISHRLDVRDRGAVESLLAGLSALDLLVLAAGVNVPNRRLDALTIESFEEILDVNLAGAFHLVHAGLPLLRRSRGIVVAVGSVSGQWPDVSGPAYQASKAGLIALARACGLEERDHGVRFATVNPGLVDTPILERRLVPPPREVLDRALRPEDVAEACLFVATRPARVHVPELTILPAELQSLGTT